MMYWVGDQKVNEAIQNVAVSSPGSIAGEDEEDGNRHVEFADPSGHDLDEEGEEDEAERKEKDAAAEGRMHQARPAIRFTKIPTQTMVIILGSLTNRVLLTLRILMTTKRTSL